MTTANKKKLPSPVLIKSDEPEPGELPRPSKDYVESYERMFDAPVGTPINVEKILDWCRKFIKHYDETQHHMRFLLEDAVRLEEAARRVLRLRIEKVK